MRVINIRGISVDALVGPEHGASRLFIWCVVAETGQIIGMHHHNGEELIRVLYGSLHFRAGDETRIVKTGEVVIVPPGTKHGYRALEDSEIEIYGEIGSSEFITVPNRNGNYAEEELFVRGHPWSRVPDDESSYSTPEQLFAKYRESLAYFPLD